MPRARHTQEHSGLTVVPTDDPVELAYRAFAVRVRHVIRLSPSFVRITFTGSDLGAFADNDNDQRIRLVFPLREDGLAHFPMLGDWYGQWRRLPAELQNPIRTYTVRAARPEVAEVDVDLVLHGDSGSASRWAATGSVGDQLVLVGPNARYAGVTAAAAWRPPMDVEQLLIGADETGVPAVSVILAGLPPTARGVAVLEVPMPADRIPLDHPLGVRIDWRVRKGGPGVALEAGVRAAAASLCSPPVTQGDDPGLSTVDLWEVPEFSPSHSAIYAWLAGEAGTVARLRRHLVRDLAVDRASVAFMGYWRLGHSET